MWPTAVSRACCLTCMRRRTAGARVIARNSSSVYATNDLACVYRSISSVRLTLGGRVRACACVSPLSRHVSVFTQLPAMCVTHPTQHQTTKSHLICHRQQQHYRQVGQGRATSSVGHRRHGFGKACSLVVAPRDWKKSLFFALHPLLHTLFRRRGMTYKSDPRFTRLSDKLAFFFIYILDRF